MTNQVLRKYLPALILGLGAAASAQSTAPGSVEDSTQFCARITRQPLTPPAFAHPAPEAELKKCDAAALYYGFERPPAPEAALQCAYYQRSHPDPGRDAFAGPGVLAMLYANGKGARNYDLAMRFVCEIEASPDETKDRISHLRKLRDSNAAATTFDLCDSAITTAMMATCDSVSGKLASAKRQKEIESIKAQWPAPAQEAFKSLQHAEHEFENARLGNEIDLTGTIHVAFVDAESEKLRDQFLTNLQHVAKNEVPSASLSAAQDADRKLNAVYQQIERSPSGAWQESTVKPSGIRLTQRTWLKLRDAWVAFAHLAYPGVDDNRLVAELTRQRVEQLQTVARSHGRNVE